MVMWVLFGYAAVAVLIAARSVLGLASEQRRKGEYIDGADRFVLGAVALLASFGWALLLPVWLVGWIGSPRARLLAARARGGAEAVRSRLPFWRRVRPAPR